MTFREPGMDYEGQRAAAVFYEAKFDRNPVGLVPRDLYSALGIEDHMREHPEELMAVDLYTLVKSMSQARDPPTGIMGCGSHQTPDIEDLISDIPDNTTYVVKNGAGDYGEQLTPQPLGRDQASTVPPDSSYLVDARTSSSYDSSDQDKPAESTENRPRKKFGILGFLTLAYMYYLASHD